VGVIWGVGLVIFIWVMVFFMVGLMMFSISLGVILRLMMATISGVIIYVLCVFMFGVLMVVLGCGLVIMCWYISRM